MFRLEALCGCGIWLVVSYNDTCGAFLRAGVLQRSCVVMEQELNNHFWSQRGRTSEPLCIQDLLEVNTQIIQKDDQIRDLNENLRALKDAMSAMQRSNEAQLSEANALRSL